MKITIDYAGDSSLELDDLHELTEFLITENVRLKQELDKALVDGKFCERQMRSAFEELADLRRKVGAL